MAYRFCFLCGKNGSQDRLERHHIFGAAYRDKSDQYNLVVDLCGESCHRNGPKAVHRNPETMAIVHAYGQKKAMKENGWTIEQFRQEFGRNYLEEENDES